LASIGKEAVEGDGRSIFLSYSAPFVAYPVGCSAHRTTSIHAAGYPLKFAKKRYAPRDISELKAVSARVRWPVSFEKFAAAPRSAPADHRRSRIDRSR
jgi:hypothetical protein